MKFRLLHKNLNLSSSLLSCARLPLLVVGYLYCWLQPGGALLAAEENPAFATSAYFEQIKPATSHLRIFLSEFPKGGDLHLHLGGAIYAETLLKWAVEDDKCINLSNSTLALPPCDVDNGTPLVKDVINDTDRYNQLIDAFSVRNLEYSGNSGHDQFFSSFQRFGTAFLGREGDMIAEVMRAAGNQNIQYVEIMQSFGLFSAMMLDIEETDVTILSDLKLLMKKEEIKRFADEAIEKTNRAEELARLKLGCNINSYAVGCDVEIRYISSIFRAMGRPKVLAQTAVAVSLIIQDSRYVGLNFIQPEDNPRVLEDYVWQMRLIKDFRLAYPGLEHAITLHAGELTLGLVDPRHLRSHIRDAVQIAGAKRIGHGVDIGFENDAHELLRHMAEQGILVEICLSSNAIILEVSGDKHPFELYRTYNIPMALATDDPGVARSDLTNEFLMATQWFNLSYEDLKQLSRNSLEFSFLPGRSLFADRTQFTKVAQCRTSILADSIPSNRCGEFLNSSEKALLQWRLERRFAKFESQYQ